MSNQVVYECGLCQMIKHHDPTKSSVPSGWYIRRVKGKLYLLCHDCGSNNNFHHGIAPHIAKMFKERYGIDV